MSDNNTKKISIDTTTQNSEAMSDDDDVKILKGKSTIVDDDNDPNVDVDDVGSITSDVESDINDDDADDNLDVDVEDDLDVDDTEDDLKEDNTGGVSNEDLTIPKKEIKRLPIPEDNSGPAIIDDEEPQQSMVDNLVMTDNSDSDSDSEDYDDKYLQKFSDEQKKTLVEEHHPEIIYHNNSEIEQMSKCVKNENSIVCDPLHMTIPFLTKFEFTRILGMRTKQINNGAKPFIKVPEGIIDGYLIAEREIREKKLPFIVKRPIPNGGCEYWKLEDLELLI